MRKKHWKRYPDGSAEQVVAHADYRKKQRKGPTMSFMGIRNPRKALIKAREVCLRKEAVLRRKANCQNTLNRYSNNVQRLKRMMAEFCKNSFDAVIVLINIDDEKGSRVNDLILPGLDWQGVRNSLETPYTYALVPREGMLGVLKIFDEEAATKLQKANGTVVVVVDYEVAEIFAA